ncbi:hypothetical protein LSH36_44g03067 [Paralvinella palmiformis]|uniref:Rhodanese domain-containing protein n=1 Tax=Paralvinella palmiformis TaxID=53620 RepID=A0AAD9K705_9ANNE|nr:hypothetical protein LSH36_44g03067 [Paralvinella palmiformis]
MAGLELIEPTDLYNLLNQGTRFPALSDPNYLLLLDARKNNEYNESHIITAKKAPKGENDEFTVPYDAELECKTNVVVYDGNTSNLKDEGNGVKCGKLMWDMGSRNPVKILKGGYEAFSALYPFLRTQKILYMPREYDEIKTYPIEIIPGFLYLGTLTQGNAAYIQKDLKVKDGYKDKNGVVLVFSDLGISRSVTVVIAYLMHANCISLKDAYNHVLRCCHSMRPNRSFISQLSKWEADIFGEVENFAVTDISDPNF